MIINSKSSFNNNMKKSTITIIITLAVFFTSFTFSIFGEGGWTFVNTYKNIKLYSRPFDSKGLKAFKSVTVVNAPIGKIVNVIRDIKTGKKWMADCVHSELIKKVRTDEFIVYYITDPPFPVQNRDAVLKIVINENKSSGHTDIQITEINQKRSFQYKKKNKKYIRVKKMRGRVILKRLGANKTLINFIFMGDPGGSVPIYFVNWGGRRIPIESIRGIKRLLIK